MFRSVLKGVSRVIYDKLCPFRVIGLAQLIWDFMNRLFVVPDNYNKGKSAR